VIEITRRVMRQKFETPGVAVTLALLAVLVAFPPALAPGPSRLIALFLVAAASVSRDASSGALQMILSRPISRTDYLLGRFVGALAAYAAFLVAAAVLSVLLARVLPGPLGAGVEGAALARELGAAFFDGVLVAATLLFFSTFLPGYGDVVAVALLWIATGTAVALGKSLERPALAAAARTIQDNLLPDVPWREVFAGSRGVPTEALGRWALAVTLYFVLAAIVFRRREFAYGQD